MDINWQRYQDCYLYRLRVSIYCLERQSVGLKHRMFRAGKRRLSVDGGLLIGVFTVLWFLSASLETYGLATVGVGATILAWTAFRVHEKAFREAALVPDDQKGDTQYQERVSMTAMNYVDAVVGVVFVSSGFTVRIAASLL